MLRTIEIECPKCRRRTPIAVSVGNSSAKSTGTSTVCRRCGERLITIAQEDGRVIILDQENLAALKENRPISPLVVMPDARAGTAHQVVAPIRLGLFERPAPRNAPKGVSDEKLNSAAIVSTDEILWRPDGTRRSTKEAAKFVGWRSIWVAELNEALRERLDGPPPLSSPPGIFLSYRWGSPAQNDWVARLGKELTRRGYPVTLDRDVPPDEMEIPRFVSRIADCRYFLAILDPGYLERVGGEKKAGVKDGWVFDEVNTARFLSEHDRLRIVGLLRDGTELPSGFRHPVIGRQGNTIDVRAPEDLRQFLDDVFPVLENPPAIADVTAARAALAASHGCLARGQFDEAFAQATRVAALLPDAVDGFAQQTRIAIAAGQPGPGLEAAQAALRLMPESGELMLAVASCAYDDGSPDVAIRYCRRLREAGRASDFERARGRYLIGTALDEVGQVHAARAHLFVARRLLPDLAQVYNDLGLVCRKLDALDEAIDILKEGLNAAPDDRNLLTNFVAAAIEARRPTVAADALAHLAEHHPDHPSLALLRTRLDAVVAGAMPPALITRVAEPPSTECIVCSKCPCAIPLSAQDQVLCGGCGSRLPAAERECPHCGSDGRIFPAFMRNGLPCVCAYCGEGTLRIETAA